jgi:hypothetical protein
MSARTALPRPPIVAAAATLSLGAALAASTTCFAKGVATAFRILLLLLTWHRG